MICFTSNSYYYDALATSWCSHIQRFQLQTSVQFIEVPIVWHHQNTSRFWVKQYDDISEGKCNGDVCWKVLIIKI